MNDTIAFAQGREAATVTAPLDTPVRDFMRPGVLAVSEDTSLLQVQRPCWPTTSERCSSSAASADARSDG
jgi:hypothetical protein